MAEATSIMPLTIAAIAFLVRGWKMAVGTVVGLFVIVLVNQWDNAMATLALTIVAAFFALLLAIPLGIWAARNETVSTIVRPVLDFLQTMPAFVYLIPAIIRIAASRCSPPPTSPPPCGCSTSAPRDAGEPGRGPGARTP